MGDKNTVKSDLPVYYAAFAVLLTMACICVILIFKNIFSAPSVNSVTTTGTVQTESLKGENDTNEIQETEEEIKISHAGLATESKKPAGDALDHPVFRSRT